ncbi:hypothetical protein N6L26_06430 [Qipengyuania sp. SS22]|uniref:hypothetical protein n=1 Tax=Qipengyuania sp. SS22 TaxID=2979461 RepID=UPI0021E56C7C|nr:hypothetical protein [Qipengyuania sp. SS22]UYH56188.1 hypothetical protein N6L26_06430 [Qipengyuania sp. SS22]
MTENFQVELSLSLHRKVTKWSIDEQIYFSAFVQAMREWGVDVVLAASNCVAEDAKMATGGGFDELSYWMKLKMEWSRFVIRQPKENVLVVSDR